MVSKQYKILYKCSSKIQTLEPDLVTWAWNPSYLGCLGRSSQACLDYRERLKPETIQLKSSGDRTQRRVFEQHEVELGFKPQYHRGKLEVKYSVLSKAVLPHFSSVFTILWSALTVVSS